MGLIRGWRSVGTGLGTAGLALCLPAVAQAAPCADLNPVNPLYGAGGAAVTASLSQVAQLLVSLPAEQRLTLFYNDPGTCTGLESFFAPEGELTFKTWDADGVLISCQAPATLVEFAYTDLSPERCEDLTGDEWTVPAGVHPFPASVEALSLITGVDSAEDSISAEALYHIYGLGPGADGHAVEPWIQPNAVFARAVTSSLHVLLAEAIGVPATEWAVPAYVGNSIIDAVATWANDDEALGYVSAAAADAGVSLGTIKTLAYQHYGQSCGYLPDSSRTRRDKLNVRTGQYALTSTGWFYAQVDELGLIQNPEVERLVRLWDGSKNLAESDEVLDILIQSGVVPLCALQALQPEIESRALASYVPRRPCNGYFEFLAAGETAFESCEASAECSGDGEVCRLGYCEAY